MLLWVGLCIGLVNLIWGRNDNDHLNMVVGFAVAAWSAITQRAQSADRRKGAFERVVNWIAVAMVAGVVVWSTLEYLVGTGGHTTAGSTP